jgi:protein SCO1/2
MKPYFRMTVLAALTMLAACSPHVKTPLHGMQLSPAQAAPNFTLTDQRGKPFSLAQTRGEAVALYFGFTHCKDVCPQTLALLGKARDKARITPQQLRIVMVSVDPRHDTPAALRAFFARVGVDATGLTGTPAQLARVWHAYGIGVQPQKHDIAHTDAIFLIDPRGRIVETLVPQSPLKDVAADLRSVLD